jgi:hypothetical protein
MYEAFVDLDELIVRCRDKLSKKFIQEAISCYRAGAFRSCIVATWNAVVFDFLHKLRELELLGDREAAKLLEEFDNLRSSGKQFRELWQFESNIPEIALTKFELISTVEKSDIERLFEDRSRCAHPSMTSLEEPFEATAELARYHLRSAVTHLLERPPVQGRAARERIFQDISSEYFPVNPDLAIKYFQKSPLARARFILIKDIVIGLTKSLLIDTRLEDERARQFSALIAVSIMYHRETREILNAQLSDIILRVMDENWDRVIIYLGSITTWDNLGEPCRLKAESYIDKIDIFETHQSYLKRFSQEAISMLAKASRVVFLRESVAQKLRLPFKDLFSLSQTCKDEIFKEKILIPILRELSSHASLDELLLMRTESLLEFDENIQAYVEEKIKASSLRKVVSIASEYRDSWLIDLIESNLRVKLSAANLRDLLWAKSRYESVDEPNTEVLELFNEFIDQQVREELGGFSLVETMLLMTSYEDDFFVGLIEPDLKEKISTANLEDLLSAKSSYKFMDKPEPVILDLLNNFIALQVGEASFDELLDQQVHWDEIADELLEPVLRNNVSAIIDRYVKSGSFNCAGSNSKLLVEIAEYLSPAQWQEILEAFFQNNQLYHSHSCCWAFETLFEKSLGNSNSLQSYWLAFREKLNKFDNKHINSLKRLIDSHV